MANEQEHIWVMSNRVDDRVVLWERDPAHPGGEAFVGGSAPALVGRSAAVARLLHEGQLVEVPEPQDGPKKPQVLADAAPAERPTMPGQVIRLGRTPDPDLFADREAATIEKAQSKKPTEIEVPDRTIVPSVEPEREQRKR